MSPFKKGVLSLLILVLSALPSQGNEVMFSPVIRNFTPSDYHGGRQNWSVSQSASGLIYVGNNQYLLEYDGHSWNRYLMPNKGIVRSVLADPDGKNLLWLLSRIRLFREIRKLSDFPFAQ